MLPAKFGDRPSLDPSHDANAEIAEFMKPIDGDRSRGLPTEAQALLLESEIE